MEVVDTMTANGLGKCTVCFWRVLLLGRFILSLDLFGVYCSIVFISVHPYCESRANANDVYLMLGIVLHFIFLISILLLKRYAI